MNILEKLVGNDYPKVETAVFADGATTIVTVSCILSPNHVDLDSASYVETKFKKHIPILKGIVGFNRLSSFTSSRRFVALPVLGSFLYNPPSSTGVCISC